MAEWPSSPSPVNSSSAIDASSDFLSESSAVDGCLRGPIEIGTITNVNDTDFEGVHVEWDASLDTFDNATNLTVESVATKQKSKNSVTTEDNVSREKVRKIDKVSNAQSKVTVVTTGSTDNTKMPSTVVVTNSPRNKLLLCHIL